MVLGIWVWFMMFRMPGQSYLGQLPPLQEEEIALQNSLKRDVQKIAVEIGIRDAAHYENLNAARTFLETALTQAGYKVKRQEYKISDKSYYNLEVERLGTSKPHEVVLIGGHYDSA